MGIDAIDRAKEEAARAGLELVDDGRRLALTDGHMLLTADFAPMLKRLRRENLRRELLARAAKVKARGSEPTAVDATAGLGEDSLILAAAGFSVTLFERNCVIAALLDDALRRAAESPELSGIVERMTAIEADSIDALGSLPPDSAAPDVILLDPMFPSKRKPSAVKKKLQLLQRLERPCEDEGALMDAAIAAHPHKIVVKRPAKGPYLAARKPSYSLSGKAVRFDCYVLGS